MPPALDLGGLGAVLLAGAPCAAAGGVLAAAIAGLLSGRGVSLSLGSLVGFVALFGITLRNAILMLSHFRRRVEQAGEPWNAETAVRAAVDRVVPVTMTALLTGMALLPVALRDGPYAVEGFREPW